MTIEELLKKYTKKHPGVPYEIKRKGEKETGLIAGLDNKPIKVKRTLHYDYIISKKNNKLYSYGDAPASIGLINDRLERKWYRYGKLHRENDRPAIIWISGLKEWWYKGKRHRENDKPAVVTKEGIGIKYFLNGKEYKPNKKYKKQKDDLRRLGLIDSTLKEFINEMLSV